MAALCPGPDFYGYTCESGAAFAYINATHDTFLYELDGVIPLQLPFAFTFYGTTYTELYASVNGNLQFGNNNSEYANTCLNKGVAAGMGDMIAPYWDDLDLRFSGFLETELVGETPNRIFVVEWDDVPRYETEEPVTFQVQLFEGSNHIVFLYENVSQTQDGNGRKATIGIQSEAQGLALQFGCNQAVVADASQIRFAHPDDPNNDVGMAVLPVVRDQTASLTAKGVAAELMHRLNLRGESALADLHRQWVNQSPPVTAVWQHADLTGDGLPELIILRHSTTQYPHLSQLIVLTPDKAGHFSLLFDQALSTRLRAIPRVEIKHLEDDLTQDGLADVLLYAPDSGHLFVLTAVTGTLTLLPVPAQCHGGLAVMQKEIVRDGCGSAGRTRTVWNGQEFVIGLMPDA